MHMQHARVYVIPPSCDKCNVTLASLLQCRATPPAARGDWMGCWWSCHYVCMMCHVCMMRHVCMRLNGVLVIMSQHSLHSILCQLFMVVLVLCMMCHVCIMCHVCMSRHSILCQVLMIVWVQAIRTGERKAVRESAFARGNVQLAASFNVYQYKVD